MENQQHHIMADLDYVLSVSDFVAVLNQTMDYAYPSVSIEGELANFRISKNKWVYFDLKDELSSVKFFGTVYALNGPLEDGLMLRVRGVPRLHNQFGFSVTVQSLQPVGEGSLKKAAALLQSKLTLEGLFDSARKRPLPYPPTRIGLIASGESAAYHDFVKIVSDRYGGLIIEHADVQVQGEPAPGQIVRAIEYFNAQARPVEVLVITRGGGSAEDLAAFNTEQVTRAVAASRIPTLVAIGHEVDSSLAELAADQRASTPSHAAEFLVPDKIAELDKIARLAALLGEQASRNIAEASAQIIITRDLLTNRVQQQLKVWRQQLTAQQNLLEALSPNAALRRGYAVIRDQQGTVVRSGRGLSSGDQITIELSDDTLHASIK